MALNLTTREQFKEFCLRKLGKPVVEVNIECQQCEDRINEAFCFWQEYHDDATQQIFKQHEITSDDVTNGYITLPENILSISQILPLDYSDSTWTSFKYQLVDTDLNYLHKSGGGTDLTSYRNSMSYFALVDFIMGDANLPVFDFNRLSNRLYLPGTTLIEGEKIMLEVFEAIELTVSEIYGDYFLLKYATALLKQQWGVNLKKFEGMQLPGGVTFNGQQIYDEATEEITKLEEEMQLRYQTPPGFMVG
jgi:hypothetical protein